MTNCYSLNIMFLLFYITTSAKIDNQLVNFKVYFQNYVANSNRTFITDIINNSNTNKHQKYILIISRKEVNPVFITEMEHIFGKEHVSIVKEILNLQDAEANHIKSKIIVIENGKIVFAHTFHSDNEIADFSLASSSSKSKPLCNLSET